MDAIQPRYSKEEFARRGDAIYERDLRPDVVHGNGRKYVAIDIETGAYEIDADELAASDRLPFRATNRTRTGWPARSAACPGLGQDLTGAPCALPPATPFLSIGVRS